MSAESNWANWPKGQSYLETDLRDIGNADSSAKGYFQFLNGTAQEAIKAGLPDPRMGDYNAQAMATRKYIETFYPKAASAIAMGDFGNATSLLNKVWPSLPGGSQSQSADRYAKWRNMLGLGTGDLGADAQLASTAQGMQGMIPANVGAPNPLLALNVMHDLFTRKVPVTIVDANGQWRTITPVDHTPEFI